MLILRLASEPDYRVEIDCVSVIAVELSHYYAKFIDVYATKIELAEGVLDADMREIVEDMKFGYEH